MKIQKKVKLPLDKVNSGLKIDFVPSANQAIASVLANWFTQIILARRLVPNLKDQYIFSVLRREFERNTGRYYVSTELRKALKEYGYKLKVRGSEVIVIKFR